MQISLDFVWGSILKCSRKSSKSFQNITVFNPYSPMMEFFYKILLSGKVFNKMNIFGFIFVKKLFFQIWSKNPKIPFRQFKLTLAERGYRFFKKKRPKRLGSNNNVNLALFCVFAQSKSYLGH